ncbi:MAG: HRDC domain-containing protein, partial [Nitrospira sp.]|nr:HRDC domain-containing protein [Nitrospira sp.]
IDSGYLQVEGAEYPTIEVTRTGQDVLQGVGVVTLNGVEARQREAPVKQQFREKAATLAARPASLVDQHLVDRLKKLRMELAEEEEVAPFVIFHDKTLKAIARHRPATPAALLDVPGIGEMKVERYGRRVLAVVNGDR